jgi:hydroxyethylthiazole kinase-like uncharacterized protein yjeF
MVKNSKLIYMDSMTKDVARSIDRLARRELGMPTLVLMENAGRSIAEAALEMLKNPGKVVIFCGKGNNAGDGFVAARHLLSQGVDIEVYLAAEYDTIKNEARVNLDILKALGLGINEVVDRKALDRIELTECSLIIDALFGVGLSGEIRGIYRDIISLVNNSKIPVLSIDIPSGLDADTGRVLGVCIEADKTVTFVSKKPGMTIGCGPACCGQIITCDIGFPSGFFSNPSK